MTTRWLAPLVLLVLSPALAYADPTPGAAPASAAPAAVAAPRKEAPAKKDAPAAAKATPARAAAAPATKSPGKSEARKSEPVAGKTAARPRPRRIIEQREQAAAKAGSEPRYDMTIAARPQQPIVNFVVEKTPVKFELPELHPGQYDVPTGLSR